jgi:hypothetical protein
MSAAGLEFHPLAESRGPATNGLKGQSSQCTSPIQESALFIPVHWMVDKESLLDAYLKVCQHLCVQRTRLPTDVLAAIGLHELATIVFMIERPCRVRSASSRSTKLNVSCLSRHY